MGTLKKYTEALRKACNETKLDYFPQVEASELLYKVITLEDIYLPLSLSEDHYEPLPYQPDNSDIDEIMRRIDEKIKAVEDSDVNNNNNNTEPVWKNEDYNNLQKVEDSSRQILIEADPGSGKTTLCKRLVLALLNNDKAFFNKYAQENKLDFDANSIPILLSCKHISEFSNEELETLYFEQIIYRICMREMEIHFSDLCESEFIEVIANTKQNRLCVILDGWDEILKKEKEWLFCERLKEYIENNHNIDIVITSRFSYVVPELVNKISRRFRICPLLEDDTRKFCQKWYETVLSSNHNRNSNYTFLADQILRSKDPQIISMRKNPLELSLLLTVSKNDGMLPENKAVLFEELVKLYVFWSTNKNNGLLSSKTIIVFLAYIATYFTKHKLMVCSDRTLKNIIKQASSELEYAFSEDDYCLEPSRIVKELSNTGILTRTYNGKRYSFSESRRGTHRQLQEYLTAYAILAQYADAEYNAKPAIEILEDKYTEKQWSEVIIFMVLMKNARVRQEIIKSLISKYNENHDFRYSNLLFSFVIKNAEISTSDKHKIYDSIFKNHITDQQISYIYDFVGGNNKNSSDFVDHINSNYFNSINSGEIDYAYAYAVIAASKAVQDEQSPFEYAYTILMTDQKAATVAGLQILVIMAWCKYLNIRNEFASCYLQYKMPAKLINKLKLLLKDKIYGLETLKCLQEMIIAGFATFNDFFELSDINNACLKLDNKESLVYSEVILSLSPLYDSKFQALTTSDSRTKNKYLDRLNNEIENNELEDIVFTFSICLTLGCFSNRGSKEKWKEIREIYIRASNSIGKAYFSILDDIYLALLYEQVTAKYNLPDKENLNAGPWSLKVITKSFAIYRDASNTLEMRIVFPKGDICDDARFVFNEEDGKVLNDSFSTYNNIAYLLRRHDISSVTIVKPFVMPESVSSLTPQRLLRGGVRIFHPISTINYALTISNIRGNFLGDYNKGKRFLDQISPFLKRYQYYWNEVLDWWTMLATERKEYEGLVVLSWIFNLKLLDLSLFTYSDLKSISRLLSKYTNRELDFRILYDAIRDEMKTYE